MHHPKTKAFLLFLGLLLGPAVASAQAMQPATRPTAWLLHLPGISGETRVDHGMIAGLRDGGYDGAVETYDWTGVPGIPALRARARNEAQAVTIAEKITEQARANPAARIVLTGHSGGAGLLVWALERLPNDVMVDDVLLIAPALSPAYDLSKALAHVRGRAYAFSSPNDVIVLGTGTTLFGTIDGVKARAAGLVGFERPATADERVYAKLVPKPYDRAWRRQGNIGTHIGPMSRTFAGEVLTPLVTGTERPATRPADG